MVKTTTSSRPVARTSLKDSIFLFKQIRRKPLKKAKSLLNDLISQKRDLDGKYYTGSSKVILELLGDAEANAEAKGLDTEKLFIKEASANKTFRFMLPKSRWSHRGKKAKLSNLKITLEER